MIRPGRRTVSCSLTIAFLGFVGLFGGARPANAISCHVDVKPVLGVSPESSAALVVFNLAAPGEVRPQPCSGELPSAPSADTHSVAVRPSTSLLGLAAESPDGLPSDRTSLYDRLTTLDRDRPPRA